MRITEIKKLRSGNYGIYADYRFMLSVDEETLIRSGLKEGLELDGPDLDGLLEETNRRKAADKAMVLLSYRDHSKQELARKIARTAGEDAAQDAAEKMEQLGLVDDVQYAGRYARELFFRRCYGQERVLYELTHKGIDRELAEQVIDELAVDNVELILRFIEKKYPKGLDDEASLRRAQAALARNGHRWEDIREAFRRLQEE